MLLGKGVLTNVRVGVKRLCPQGLMLLHHQAGSVLASDFGMYFWYRTGMML